MLICKLCGLTVGEYHLLRKVLAPRTRLRPRKRHPDQEAPPGPLTNATPPFIPPPVMGTHAYEIPEHTPTSPVEAPEGETLMERAFRLVKT